MEVNLRARVLAVKAGKNGMAYVTLWDLDEGSDFQIGIPGGEGLKIDQLVQVKGTLKVGRGKFGTYAQLTSVKNQEKGE